MGNFLQFRSWNQLSGYAIGRGQEHDVVIFLPGRHKSFGGKLEIAFRGQREEANFRSRKSQGVGIFGECRPDNERLFKPQSCADKIDKLGGAVAEKHLVGFHRMPLCQSLL